MITKESEIQKKCLFCASEYHLEMILLPYIKNKIEKSNIIIFTEQDLEKSIEKLLEKVNLNKEIKQKIIQINWKNEDKSKKLNQYITEENELYIIINGSIEYIEKINKKIKKLIVKNKKNISIIDCINIQELDEKRENINLNYTEFLNTQKL